MSIDNTVGLGADTWRHVAFIEQRQPARTTRTADLHHDTDVLAMAADGTGPASECRVPLADVLRRVQALHARRLPRRLPDRVAVPHRVRHRRRAGGHLQRLRLLHPRLPLRRHRPAQGRRPGLEVHAVLRPARRGAGTGLRQGLPDRLDPVRPARRAARAGRRPGRAAARGGRGRRPPLRPRPGRRRRRRRRVLPAARRARGLRAAAGPGGHHPRPAAHVAAGRGRRADAGRPLSRPSPRGSSWQATATARTAHPRRLRAAARSGAAPGRRADRAEGGRRRAGGSPRCRTPPSPPTTASRSSTGRSGRPRTSPATCSSAAWPAPSSLLAAGAAAHRAARPGARRRRSAPLAAGVLSLAALVHDLGRPSRFLTCCGCSR